MVNLQEENAELKKQIESLLRDKAKNLKADLKNEIKEINGVNFLAKKVDLDAGGIKDLCFQLGDEIDNLFLIFGTEQDGKALLSCYISKNLVEEKDLNAGKIVKRTRKIYPGRRRRTTVLTRLPEVRILQDLMRRCKRQRSS